VYGPKVYGQGGFQGPDGAPVVACGNTDASVFLGAFDNDLGGLVDRAVIPNEQIEVCISLSKHAFDGPADISLPVISPDDY
jgi:hypothetical protein